MPIDSATVICTWSTICRFQIGSKMPFAKRSAMQVLDGLLAEVVVDPEDLVLVEPLAEHRAQLARRREVVPERLLDDHARPAVALSALADLANDVGRTQSEGRRGSGARLPARAAGPVELLEGVADAVLAALVGELRRDVAHPGGERLEHVASEWIPRVLLHRLAHRGQELPRRSAPCARRRRCRTARAAGPGTRARRARGTACAAVRSPDAPKTTSAHGSGVRRTPEALGERVRRGRLPLARDDCFALGRDPVQQLRERVGELLDAFALEGLDDVVVVDARPQRARRAARAPRRGPSSRVSRTSP